MLSPEYVMRCSTLLWPLRLAHIIRRPIDIQPPVRILALEMLAHMFPRIISQTKRFSHFLQVELSLVAGVSAAVDIGRRAP